MRSVHRSCLQSIKHSINSSKQLVQSNRLSRTLSFAPIGNRSMTSSTDMSINHSKLPWAYSDENPPVGTPSKQASDRPIPALFKPITIRGLTLKNRIVVSPMCMYSATNGFVSDFHLIHLGQFALGGSALVVQEAAAVTPNGRISGYDVGLWSDEHTIGNKRIVDFVHSQQAAIGVQIAHAGRKASMQPPFLPSGVAPEPIGWPNDVIAPSALAFHESYPSPRAMTIDEISTIEQAFVDAAIRADKCGYDLVEIHAAHGYLLNQFLSPLSNARTDEYGGSFENRCRLLLDVTRRVRAVWPSDKPLSVRLSCDEWIEGGWTIDDTCKLVPMLLNLGVDIIDASSGGNSHDQHITVGPGYQLPFAETIKRVIGQQAVTTAAVGMITEPHQANEVVESGTGDLVMLAREMLRDPHFPMRAAQQLRYDMNYAPQYARSKRTLH